MKIKDGMEEKFWEALRANCPSADDPGYGLAVFMYAVSWADTMEYEMRRFCATNDEVLCEIDWRGCEPKGHGITGFQYGAAVATLRDFWEHGDELNQLHNRGHGHPNAKGTVNPALLTVKTQ